MSLPPLSLRTFVQKAAGKMPLHVVFLGGSLTWGANASDPQKTSWRALMMRHLQHKYPATAFTFHDAAIGGTGSLLGMFRLERDVLPCKPDLVFLDFTVNDGLDGRDMESLAAYECIVRQLLEAGAMVVPVLLPVKTHVETSSHPLPPRYADHKRLARAYGLPAIEVLEQLRTLIQGGLDPASLWNIGRDQTHPGDEGYTLFFEIIRDHFEAASLAEEKALIPSRTFFEDLYPKRNRRMLTADPLPPGWTREKTYRSSLWFDGLPSRWMGDVAAAAKKNRPAALDLAFEGSLVGIFGQRNGLTPPVRIWIDGTPLSPSGAGRDDFIWKMDTGNLAPAKKGTGNLFLWKVLAHGLKEGPHHLRIEPVFENADPEAELHIESICSAGR